MSLEVYKGPWAGIENKTASAITVGTFDGIHRGHQQILAALKKIASEQELTPTLVTFDPHPQELLKRKKPDIRILTDIDEKKEILEQLGVSRLVVLDFNKELAQLSPKTFVEQVFVKRLCAKQVVIGYDHAFGKNRIGSKELLISLGQEHGFDVSVVDPIDHYGIIISSTIIRSALYNGDVALAGLYLGRSYAILGKVVPGDKRGRTLGIPTANIHPIHLNKLIPADGVYSGHATVGSDVYQAAISIGSQPTYKQANDNAEPLLEVHLLNFQGNIYGQLLQVRFEQKIRNQMAFASADKLVRQMKADINIIKKIT